MNETTPNSFRTQPDDRGHFGDYGGRYVAETLMPLILDLEREYRAAQEDPAFQAEFDGLIDYINTEVSTSKAKKFPSSNSSLTCTRSTLRMGTHFRLQS